MLAETTVDCTKLCTKNGNIVVNGSTCRCGEVETTELYLFSRLIFHVQRIPSKNYGLS